MANRHPNILWLMTDEQRCDSLGCYGSPWAHTPNLDALAAEGAVFETAITPAPVCVPARTALLAGKYPCETGVWHNRLDLRTPHTNLMKHFHRAGYQTATFGKQHYAGAGSAFATEVGPTLSSHVNYFSYADGYDETRYDVVKYPGTIYPWIFGGQFPASAEATAEAQAVRNAMTWLDAVRQEAPFFLRISFNGPHTPVTPPAPFDRLIDPDAISLAAEWETLPPGSPPWLSRELRKCSDASVLSPEHIRKMRQYYYGEVAFLDSLFGQMLDWMQAGGLLDNTLVVYVSDHGTHLGDFGLVQKQTFFDPVIKVPFMVRFPSQIAPGLRLHTPMETQSMLPTLMELAGLPPPGDGCAPSLAPCLRSGREPTPRPVFSEFALNSFAPHIEHDGRLVMVRHGDWKLTACLDPELQDVTLHNLKHDPYEQSNRANDPDCVEHRGDLLRLISDHIAGTDQAA